MSDLDELLSRDGVLIAGRLDSDCRIVEHDSKDILLRLEPESAYDLAHWFLAAVTGLFKAMSFVGDRLKIGGSLNTSTWQPVKGWSFFGGDYGIVVRGDRFAFVEAAKIDSFDELNQLLAEQVMTSEEVK